MIDEFHYHLTNDNKLTYYTTTKCGCSSLAPFVRLVNSLFFHWSLFTRMSEFTQNPGKITLHTRTPFVIMLVEWILCELGFLYKSESFNHAFT